MNVFELSVPGDPLSKARPRVYNGHGITDRRTRNAENRVYSEFRRKYALNGVAYQDDVQIVEAQVSKVLPDRRVPGSKPGSMRNRKTGDPLLFMGEPYEPHTEIHISEIINPTN